MALKKVEARSWDPQDLLPSAVASVLFPLCLTFEIQELAQIWP